MNPVCKQSGTRVHVMGEAGTCLFCHKELALVAVDVSDLRRVGHRLAGAIEKGDGLHVDGSGGPVDDSLYELDLLVDDERFTVTLTRSEEEV